MKFKFTFPKEEYKGGPGSGHHGHAGRPGKHGGSAPGSGGVGTTGVDKDKAVDIFQSVRGTAKSHQFQHPDYRIIGNNTEVTNNGVKYIATGTARRSGTVYGYKKDEITRLLDVVGVDHTKDNIATVLAFMRHGDASYTIDKLVG